jgi:hypothetical protein
VRLLWEFEWERLFEGEREIVRLPEGWVSWQWVRAEELRRWLM